MLLSTATAVPNDLFICITDYYSVFIEFVKIVNFARKWTLLYENG
jgi:hypothetical protein